MYIHFGIWYSAAGCIKECLKHNKENKLYGEVRVFQDDLSIGSIYNLENDKNQRVQWFEKMIQETGNLDDLAADIINNYLSTLRIEKNDKIIIWHGDNVIEQLALRYIVSQFRDAEIFEILVSDHIVKEYCGKQYRVRSVGECSPSDLGGILHTATVIPKDRIEKLCAEWEVLRNLKGTLRVLEVDEIIEVDEDYYDEKIISCITDEYIKAARVIGDVLGTSNQIISDLFIDYRLRILIKQQKIMYIGDLKSMRDFSVKRVL